MLSLLAIASVLLSVVYTYTTYRAFTRRLSEAKQSGIPYVIVPVFLYNRFWLVTQELWLPLIRKLPQSWTSSWLTYVEGQWPWTQGHAPFQELGTDTFLAVAPGRCVLWTCEPDVISQITARRHDFPKPIEMYKILNVYGPNVIGTEGTIWRHHRKVTAPQFTEGNNQLVWSETLEQTQLMLNGWLGSKDPSHAVIPDLASDVMRVTLHIISRAGFGKKLLWPGQEGPILAEPHPSLRTLPSDLDKGQSSAAVPTGHQLSYKDALSEVLRSLLLIILLPHSLLRNSPLQVHKRAWSAFVEWGDYMTELMEEKKKEVRDGSSEAGLDLMGALVRGAGVIRTQDTTKATSKGQMLSDEEIIGNAFVFLLAGHETTAGSLNHAILYLACNPLSQCRLQQDLDGIFGDRAVGEWDFEKDIGKLFNGMAGAVMNETLRLMPPVIAVPKSTQAQPQPLTIGGKRVVVPADSYVMLNAVAAQRNPKYWPGGSAQLDEFHPERWFTDTGMSSQAGQSNGHVEEDKHMDDIAGGNHPSTLFSPPRGAYLPFSDGYRACLGRRFAQVEFLGVLAMIFTRYSIELDVQEWATEAEFQRMPPDGPERKAVWEKARDEARRKMTLDIESRRTLTMRSNVSLKIVRRGREMSPTRS